MIRKKQISQISLITFTVIILLSTSARQEVSGMIPSQTLPIHLDLALIEPSTKTLYPTPTQSLLRASAIANRECLQPFSTFAYQGPVDRSFQSKLYFRNGNLSLKHPLNLPKGLAVRLS